MTSRPVPLRSFLESNRRFGNLLSRIRASQRTLEHVRHLLPTELAPHLTAALREGDRLVLFAASPVWASRLRFAVPVLRASLDAPIRDVRIRTAPERGIAPTRNRRSLQVSLLSPQSADQIRQIATAIADPQLSQALRRLASHCKDG
jgi:hypothetical protein